MFDSCLNAITTNQGLIASLFLAGLVGGATHCTGMCAPFVLAQVDGKPHATVLQRIAGVALIPYHLGRMTTYIAMAVLLSSVLNLAFLFQPVRLYIVTPMLVSAAVIFLVNAFPQALKIFPWAARISLPVPFRVLQKIYGVLIKRKTLVSGYLTGVLLGFMPCGLVVSALMASASAQNILGSALAMAAFTFGTVPSLVMVALGGSYIKRRFPVLEKKVTQGLMVCSALWLFIVAGQAFM